MAFQPQEEKKEELHVWPKDLLINQAYAFGFSCVKCGGIPLFCMNNNDGEVLCSICAKDIPNTTPVKAINNIINKLQSKCLSVNIIKTVSDELNEGDVIATQSNEATESCQWIGTIGEWKEHKKSCQFLTISCDKCKSHKCERRKLSDHHESCGEVTIKCSLLCGVSILRKNQNNHINNDCLEKVLLCSNDDCKEEIKRQDFKAHVTEQCEHRIVECKFVKYGCKVEGIKVNKLKDHLDEYKFEHLSNKFDFINKTLSSKIESLSNTNRQQQQQIDTLTQSLKTANKSISELQSMESLRNASQVNVQFDRYDSRMVKIERNGKILKNSCYCSACAYSSTGYNSGIKSWKIKVIKTGNEMGDQFGAVSRIYNNGSDCWRKEIKRDGGVGSGTESDVRLRNGKVYNLILDFNINKLFILENGKFQGYCDLGRKTYYPVIQFTGKGQHFEVV